MDPVVFQRDPAGADVTPWMLEFAKSVGVPALIAVVVLVQLQPKIDRGIAIADHVDALLTVLAQRGCGTSSSGTPQALPMGLLQSASPYGTIGTWQTRESDSPRKTST